MIIVITHIKTGRMITTYGLNEFKRSMGGQNTNDCIELYNMLNHNHKAVRI